MSKGQCTLCGDIMESKHRHDFVRCKCGKSFLDGGDDYWRGTMTTVMIDDKTHTDEGLLAYLHKLDKEQDKMGKHSKESPLTEKMLTLEDADQMSLTQFQNGQRSGMYKCHDIVNDSIERLRRSLEDVWAIEYSGVITPEKKARAAELTFAIDTLTIFDDMFQAEYDTGLSKLDKEAGKDYV